MIGIWVKYFSKQEQSNQSIAGHFSGALAGLLMGTFALENRRVEKWEVVVQRFAIALFFLFVIVAIVVNIFGVQFPTQEYGNYCWYYE